ncbi:MAG: Imm50 family immunity protein [Planctomycetaceae bacterium]
MSWSTLLLRKQAVESIYSTTPPLVGVRLHEVRQHEDGPRVSLRFDLNDFPDKPPQKWLTSKFNRVQLTLMLIDVQDFTMKGWGTNNIGDIEIVAAGGGVNLVFDAPSVHIACSAGYLDIEGVSAYLNSELM